MNWAIIGPILGAALVCIAVFWARWQKAKNLLKEFAEALTAVSNAIEDDNITETEAKNIVQQWSEVITAAKTLIWG